VAASDDRGWWPVPASPLKPHEQAESADRREQRGARGRVAVFRSCSDVTGSRHAAFHVPCDTTRPMILRGRSRNRSWPEASRRPRSLRGRARALSTAPPPRSRRRRRSLESQAAMGTGLPARTQSRLLSGRKVSCELILIDKFWASGPPTAAAARRRRARGRSTRASVSRQEVPAWSSGSSGHSRSQTGIARFG